MIKFLIATQKEHENIVQFLFSNGANVNISNKNSTSSLYAACVWGHCSIAQFYSLMGQM